MIIQSLDIFITLFSLSHMSYKWTRFFCIFYITINLLFLIVLIFFITIFLKSKIYYTLNNDTVTIINNINKYIEKDFWNQVNNVNTILNKILEIIDAPDFTQSITHITSLNMSDIIRNITVKLDNIHKNINKFK